MKKILLILLLLNSFIANAQLNHQWALNPQDFFEPSGNIEGRSIKMDASGSIYITGHFQNTADFDPGVPVCLI